MPSSQEETKAAAKKLCPQKAAEEARERNLQAPLATEGRLPTLTDADGNQYGAMTDKIVEELNEFIEIASRADANVLEIGAAYGSPYLIEAFKKENSAHYTACDLFGDQLRILAKRIQELYPSKLSNLTLIEGPFPHKEVVDNLQEGGYDAVMASSVLHFLTEEEVVESFKQVYRLLKPGGKVFAKMASPYNGVTCLADRERIAEEKQNYLVHKKRPLPGFVKNMRDVARMRESFTEQELSDLGLGTEIQGFVFDREITKVFLESEGFLVEFCDYKPFPTFPIKFDGREHLLLVAQKPN